MIYKSTTKDQGLSLVATAATAADGQLLCHCS